MEPTNQNPSPSFNSGTKKKNFLLILLVICAALAVVFFSASLVRKIVEKNQAEKSKATPEVKTFLGVKCDFANNEAVMQKAKEDKNTAACECIQEENYKFRCQEGAQNAAYFAQARAQFNGKFCEDIKNNSQLKESCSAMVSSGIEYLQKQDPEYLANVYAASGNYDGAIAILSVSEKVQTEVSTMLALALNYAGKGLITHQENVYVPKAEALINQALKLNPESAEAYRVQGYIYEVKPDFAKAVESYNKALEKDPNFILALTGRAHAYNLMGDLNKALEDFQKAAALDKDKKQLSIYANLCRLQTSRSDLLAEGIQNCQIALASPAAGPELKSDTSQILADTYIKEKKFTEALTLLENARIFSSQNVNLFVSFANLYMVKEDYPKAIEESQKAIAIDPLKTIAYLALAQSYLKTRDYTQAETQALKGLEVIDKDPSLLVPNKPAYRQQLNYTLVDIFTAKGDKEKAAQYKTAGESAMKTP